ncbi:copper resistance protein B [Sphingopyxis jiangsuensis]|uniref:copper resistance protein B n=1 Tax=Sphingopyxis jiangsuensis TaxID=2871171 RepID=UPI002ED4FDAF
MSMIALLFAAAQPPHAGHVPPPALACTPDHAAMGHCTMPEPPAASPPPSSGCTAEHAAMGHCKSDTPSAEVADPHGSHDNPPGNEAAPAPPRVDAADTIFGADAMRGPRERLYAEHGGGKFSKLMIDEAEWRAGQGSDGYAWDAEAWIGGDIDRLVLKSEGEGAFGGDFEGGEAQALWSHAIGPYFDVQAGVRQDFGPGASPTHAVLGIEGLAPYWFEVEGALFVSHKGDVTARFEASYDQRITQRLIAQPMAEADFAMQNVTETGVGAGLSSIELGLRLRYEFVREFAPYVGVVWERKIGRTARLARSAGEDASRPSFVAGVRFWF